MNFPFNDAFIESMLFEIMGDGDRDDRTALHIINSFQNNQILYELYLKMPGRDTTIPPKNYSLGRNRNFTINGDRSIKQGFHKN